MEKIQFDKLIYSKTLERADQLNNINQSLCFYVENIIKLDFDEVMQFINKMKNKLKQYHFHFKNDDNEFWNQQFKVNWKTAQCVFRNDAIIAFIIKYNANNRKTFNTNIVISSKTFCLRIDNEDKHLLYAKYFKYKDLMSITPP